MDNIGALIVPAVIALVAISIVAKGVRVVQQAQTMIIERLGRYHRTLSSGVNLIIPIIDKPRAIDWHQVIVTPAGDSFARHFRTEKIDLRETVYVFPRQNVITKDNVVVEIDALIYSQITDPVRATYEIANLPDAIEKLTQTTLRNVIGEMELDHVLSSRDTINAKLREILDEATHKWGSKVSRVELKDINPPRDIRDAMEKQMRAERDRRAAILTAEAEKQSRTLQSEGIRQSEINKAEGDKQARILAAEGEANARLKVAEAEAQAIERITAAIKGTGGDPARYLIAIRYIEALKDMVTGQNNKVIYMPYEATGGLSSLGADLARVPRDPAAPDAVAAQGERLSAGLMTAALAARGVPAREVDARRCIVTDTRPGKAEPLLPETDLATRAALEPLLAAGEVPVLGGYIGATPEGVTTTLGRGGSDYSASLIGAALGASEIQIWTDVSGVLTADPTVAPTARTIPKRSFAYASALAYFGARVLHPKTILPAIRHGIPVRIRNSRAPEDEGTRVAAESEVVPHTVKAIAHKTGVSIVSVTSTRMLGAYGFLRALFEVFERHRTVVDLVATSEVSVS